MTHSGSRWSIGHRLACRGSKLAFSAVLGACIGGGAVAFAGTASDTTPASAYLQRSAQTGVLRGKAVTFSGHRVTIPVIAGAPDTTFEIHGQVNPTLIVPAGAKIRFELANADKGMTHGLDVTRQSPPYAKNPALPMQKPSATRGEKTRAASGAIAGTGVIPPAHQGRWTVKRSTWVTLAPGTYYYACPVPGHARDGMYGRIVVKARGNGKPD